MNHDLTLEACALGTEAVKIAFKANALALDDPQRWPLTRRMLEINHRLQQLSAELKHSKGNTDESRTVS